MILCAIKIFLLTYLLTKSTTITRCTCVRIIQLSHPGSGGSGSGRGCDNVNMTMLIWQNPPLLLSVPVTCIIQLSHPGSSGSGRSHSCSSSNSSRSIIVMMMMMMTITMTMTITVIIQWPMTTSRKPYCSSVCWVSFNDSTLSSSEAFLPTHSLSISS